MGVATTEGCMEGVLMKLFYSIDELASIIGECTYDTADALKAEGVLMTHKGEPANLRRWTGGASWRGNVVTVRQGYYDDPKCSSEVIFDCLAFSG